MAGDDPANIPPHPSQLDQVHPKAKPSSYDPARSTVVDAESTPTKRTWANPDGSRTLEVVSRPRWFKDANGVVRDLDMTVVADADGSLRAKAGPGAAKLAGKAGGDVARVETTAGTVVLRHPGASAAGAVVDKTKGAKYAKALPGGRDVTLAPTPTGFEESVTLADATAAPKYLDQLVLPPGLTARQGLQGVELVDQSAAVVATFGDGLAFDASFPAAGPSRPPLSA